MQVRRLHRLAAVTVTFALAGVGGIQSASAHDDNSNNGKGDKADRKVEKTIQKFAEKTSQLAELRARMTLETDRLRAQRQGRPISKVEARGTVAAVDAVGKLVDLAVSESNQAAFRGQRVIFGTSPQAFVALGGKLVTLADLRVGDTGKLTGLLDTGTGAKVAYLLQMDRPKPKPPAPTRTVGTVATADAAGGTYVLTVKGLPVPFTLGVPSIVTLNGQPSTLVDARANDQADVTSVPDGTGRQIAYVTKLSRSLPPTPAPVKVEGLVASVTPSGNTFTVTLKNGIVGTIVMSAPSIVTLNDVAATLADVRVNDRVTVTAIQNSAGGLVAFVASFTGVRPVV